MKTRPIPFKGAMVRAILDGSKTQTRRIAKPPFIGIGDGIPENFNSPFGQIGDQLYVRESARVLAVRGGIREIDIQYQADSYISTVKYPSRLAPAPLGKLLANGTYREASRITLEITGVRVERLNEISDGDAKAEGADGLITSDKFTAQERELLDIPLMEDSNPYRNGYALLWESINGAGSWEANPWVWVIEFKVVKS